MPDTLSVLHILLFKQTSELLFRITLLGDGIDRIWTQALELCFLNRKKLHVGVRKNVVTIKGFWTLNKCQYKIKQIMSWRCFWQHWPVALPWTWSENMVTRAFCTKSAVIPSKLMNTASDTLAQVRDSCMLSTAVFLLYIQRVFCFYRNVRENKDFTIFLQSLFSRYQIVLSLDNTVVECLILKTVELLTAVSFFKKNH